MSGQLLQNNTDVVVRGEVRKLPADISLEPASQTSVDSKGEDVSLLGTINALSRVTDLVSDQSASPSSSTTETEETTTENTEDEYEDTALIDFSTNQPSSGGTIGGSVVGISSKYLLDQQDSLMNLSINALELSATNNELQGTYATKQKDQALAAANDQYRAGMMQVGSELGVAGVSAVGATAGTYHGATHIRDNIQTKQTTIKDCDAQLDAINQKTPANAIATSGSASSKHMAEAKNNVIGDAFKEGDGIPKDEHYEARAKEVHNKQITDAQGNPTELARLNRATNGKNDNVETIKTNLKASVEQYKNNKGALDIERQDVKESLASMDPADKKTARAKINERKTQATNELKGAQDELLSYMQKANMYKELGSHFIQGAFKVPQTILERTAARENANAQLYGTVASQLANLSGSYSSLSAQMANQAMSTMQGTMDALRRAANPG